MKQNETTIENQLNEINQTNKIINELKQELENRNNQITSYLQKKYFGYL